MNVKKEVYEKCKNMIERELSDATYKIIRNKREINRLAKEQRILRATKGELYKLLKTF